MPEILLVLSLPVSSVYSYSSFDCFSYTETLLFITLLIVNTSMIFAMICFPVCGFFIIHSHAVSNITSFIWSGFPSALSSSLFRYNSSRCSFNSVVNVSQFVIVSCPVINSSTLSRAHHTVSWLCIYSFSCNSSLIFF